VGTEEKKFDMNKQQSTGVGGNYATTFFNQPLLTSIQLVIEAMGGGGNVIIGVEGGQGREDTTINWWRTRQIPSPNLLLKLLEGFSVLSLY
jgi:hypothetical protein